MRNYLVFGNGKLVCNGEVVELINANQRIFSNPNQLPNHKIKITHYVFSCKYYFDFLATI